MKEQILKELSRLEQVHEIHILCAVESGSRAWGFESTDSDWDVRFIYIHKPEWYLSIRDHKDNIEEMLPNALDLAGWDLRKTLNLFRKSNPPLLEWLSSPIVYKEDASFTDQLRKLQRTYFNPKNCMHHYLSMAAKNFYNYLEGESVRVKKYFYVLRPALACKHIAESNQFPPLEFHKLLDIHIKDKKLRLEIDQLLERKRSGEELDKEPRNDVLNAYLESELLRLKNFLKEFKLQQYTEVEMLDRLFLDTLKKVWSWP